LKMLSPSGNALMPASALVCGWESTGRGNEAGSGTVGTGEARGKNLKETH
jgi:hypothetical protein